MDHSSVGPDGPLGEGVELLGLVNEKGLQVEMEVSLMDVGKPDTDPPAGF